MRKKLQTKEGKSIKVAISPTGRRIHDSTLILGEYNNLFVHINSKNSVYNTVVSVNKITELATTDSPFIILSRTKIKRKNSSEINTGYIFITQEIANNILLQYNKSLDCDNRVNTVTIDVSTPIRVKYSRRPPRKPKDEKKKKRRKLVSPLI